MTRAPWAGRPGFLIARTMVTVIGAITFFGMLIAPPPVGVVFRLIFGIDVVVMVVLTWMRAIHLRSVVRERRADREP